MSESIVTLSSEYQEEAIKGLRSYIENLLASGMSIDTVMTHALKIAEDFIMEYTPKVDTPDEAKTHVDLLMGVRSSMGIAASQLLRAASQEIIERYASGNAKPRFVMPQNRMPQSSIGLCNANSADVVEAYYNK